MSDAASLSRALLRRPRRALEVVLGSDGRLPPPDLLTGLAEDRSRLTQAADIVEEARRHAEEILRHAAVEAGAIERHAREAGYRAGFEAGTVQARADLAQAMALVQRAVATSKAMHDALLRGAERQAVELVIEAARQVIGAAVERDPGLALATVRRALERAGALNVVCIRLHPDDEGVVRVALAEEHGRVMPFEVLADGSVTVGGCIIDTEAGRIDARLDVQLEQISQSLRDAAPAVAA